MENLAAYFLDDDHTNTKVYVKKLCKNNLEAKLLTNVTECIKLAEENQEKGLFTIILVSGEDSINAITPFLEKLAPITTIKVILFSFLEEIGSLKEVLESGFDDYIIKPTPLEIFVLKLSIIEKAIKNELAAEKLSGDKVADAMVTTLCHEINNPLTILKGFLSKNVDKLTNENLEKARLSLERISETVLKIKRLKKEF